MTRFGTAFVAIEPDFSSFDSLVKRKLTTSLAGAGERGGMDFSDGFTQTFARQAQSIGKPLDKSIADFNTKLRTKIEAPKIPPPKLPDVDLSKTARLDLQIAGAEAQAEKLRTKIAELTAQPASIEVKAQIAKAVADLDRVEAKVTALSAKRAEVKVDVDRSLPGVFASISASVQGLLASLSGGGGGGLSGATARVSAGFVSFGSVVGPLAAGLAALAVTIGVSLVASLAALVSSLALAAAGVGALGAAVGGVLVPAVALAVGTGLRLGKVFEALKASDAATDQASQKALAGSQAQAAAAKQQESAARGLAEANRQLGVATSNAYREMADAAEAASDAIRGVANAQLSLDQAKLSTQQAELELRKFRAELGATSDEFKAAFDKFTDVSVDTSGLRKALADANKASRSGLDPSQELELEQKILDVRAARLREKDAVDGVSDAITASTRAQALDNKFKREGIKASESYQAALRGVQSATLAVAQAQETQGFGTAQAKAINLTDKLTDRERQLLAAIKQVRKELTGAFKGATDAVFGGMIRALGRLPSLVNPLRASFTRLGEAWGEAIDSFSADLIKPKMISNLRAFTDGAAELAGPITDSLSSLLRIFLNIGRAALPSLVRGTKSVADHLADWADATDNTEKLGRSIRKLVGHTKAWLGAFAAVSRTILAFFGVAAPEGKRLAGSIKELADNTTAWLNKSKNQEKVREFLHDAVGFTKQFVEFMGRLVEVVTRFSHTAIRVFGTVVEKLGGAKNATDVLVYTLGTLAALKFTKGVLRGIRDLHAAITGARKAATLLHAKLFTANAAEASGGFLAKAKDALKSIGSGLASAASTVVEASKKLGRRLIAIFAAEGAVAGRAAGTAAAGTSGLGSRAVKTRIAASGATTGRLIGKSIVGGILLSIPLLVWEFKDAINKIGRDLKNATVAKVPIGEVLFGAQDIGESIGKALGDPEAIFGAVSDAASSALNFIQRNWPQLLGILTGPIGLAATAIGNSFSAIKGAASATFTSVRGSVGDAVGGIGDAISGVADTIGSFASDVFGAGADLGHNIAAGIASVAASIASTVAKATRGGVDAVGTFFGRMFNQGRDFLLKLRDGVVSVAGKIADAVRNAVSDAITAVGTLIGRMEDAGERVGRALIRGIKSILGDVGGIAADLGKTLANAVIGLLNKAIPDKIPVPLGPDINLPDNPIPKFRRGGQIPGTGTGDKIHILAEPLEYMIRRKVVTRFGPTVFADINEGRLDPTVGYEPGERPSVSTRPVKGAHYALGGVIAARTTEAPQQIHNNTFPINVVGGGPPDPLDLVAKAFHAVESRAGGDVRQA